MGNRFSRPDPERFVPVNPELTPLPERESAPSPVPDRESVPSPIPEHECAPLPVSERTCDPPEDLYIDKHEIIFGSD